MARSGPNGLFSPFLRAGVEHTEAPQYHTVAARLGGSHGFKQRAHRFLRG